MLDIKTIKKIFKLFDIQGFSVVKWSDVYYTFSCAVFEHPQDLKDFHSYNDLFFDVAYPLLLQRVIEAINKKNFNEGSYSFSYQILTEIDNYHVYDKYKEKTLERFYFGKRHDYDTKKEQAIIWVMDHIKEKV